MIVRLDGEKQMVNLQLLSEDVDVLQETPNRKEKNRCEWVLSLQKYPYHLAHGRW